MRKFWKRDQGKTDPAQTPDVPELQEAVVGEARRVPRLRFFVLLLLSLGFAGFVIKCEEVGRGLEAHQSFISSLRAEHDNYEKMTLKGERAVEGAA